MAEIPATVRAEVLRDFARTNHEDMANAWGGPRSWLTSGQHVADLVAEWVNETADEIEATP